MIVRTTMILLLIVTMCVAIGCGDDDKVTAGKTNESDGLVGTWTFQSAKVNGMAVALSDLIPWMPNTATARMEIGADGTFMLENVSADGTILLTSPGTFVVSGNSFSIADNADMSLAGTWAVAGDRLTLDASLEGFAVEIIATR